MISNLNSAMRRQQRKPTLLALNVRAVYAKNTTHTRGNFQIGICMNFDTSANVSPVETSCRFIQVRDYLRNASRSNRESHERRMRVEKKREKERSASRKRAETITKI